MTLYRDEKDERYFRDRFGNDVYNFLKKDPKIIDYLFDHIYIVKNLKNQARNFQLSDNSVFVLPICKVFEGALYLLAKEKEWFAKFNRDKKPDNIRKFYRQKRKNIEEQVDQYNHLTGDQKQAIKDKLFSTIEDFVHRHEAVHFGSMLKAAEIENYDAVLTKIKELIEVFIHNNLL